MFFDDIVILLGLIILLIIIPAIISRKEYFFRYILLNFFAFAWFSFMGNNTMNSGYRMYILEEALRSGIYPEYGISMNSLLPAIFTPICCYFLVRYEKPKSLFDWLFIILNIVLIVATLYMLNTVYLVYPYFILSLIVFLLLRKQNSLQRAAQATTIGMGIFGIFSPFYTGYLIKIYTVSSESMRTFWAVEHHFLNYEINNLSLLGFSWFFLYIVIGILLISFFSYPTADEKLVRKMRKY